MSKDPIRKQAHEAAVVFSAKMYAQDKNDADVRLVIKTLRAVLLVRQRHRAAVKTGAAHA